MVSYLTKLWYQKEKFKNFQILKSSAQCFNITLLLSPNSSILFWKISTALQNLYHEYSKCMSFTA